MSTTTSLSPAEIKWIMDNSDAKVIEGIDESLDIEGRKRTLLKEAREKLDSSVGEIKVGENFDIETLGGFLKTKLTMSSIGETADDEEFDTGHDLGKVTGMDGKDFALLMNAQSILATETEKLKAARRVPGKREPLFTDKEIAEAIWAPMMRRKLIPENAIPDRYSEVTNTFSGASAAYETRLAAYTDGLSDFDKAIKRLGIAKDVIDGLGAVATGVTSDLGAFGVTKDPYEVATMIKGIQLACTSTTTIATAILKENGKINWTSVEAICKDLQKMVPAMINAGEAGGSWDDVNFGKCLAYAVGGAFSAPLIIKKMKEGKYAEILDDLGNMAAAACNAYTYDVKSTGEKDEGPGGKGVIQFNEFGMIVSGIASTASALLAQALKDEKVDTGVMLKIMQGAAQKTIDAGSMVRFDQEKSALESQAATNDHTNKTTDNTEVQPNSPDLALAYGIIEPEWQTMRDAAAGATGWGTPDKILKAIQTHGSVALEKLSKDDPLYKKMAGYAKLIDKQQEEIQAAGLETLDEELAESGKEFRNLMSRSESGDSEEEVEKIEQLVLQLKKDQMITNLVLQLAPLPAQAIAAFLPQANIAVAAIELIKNARKAIEHYKAYAEWQENMRDARSAMSVQVEAMVNRANISRNQGIDEVISGLENACKIVAGAVGCAGPFAPAGHVVSATVVAVSTIRQLCTKYYRENELNKAWRKYKSALDNPEDRKTVRAAIRGNPTLAKYVVAWGADVDNNPVAKSALQKCGLTLDVMSNPGTNVSKVVTFLETVYPDDPTLLREVDRPEEWYPGPVVFSATSVAAFVGAAETAAKPPLTRGTGNPLVTQFTRWETLSQTYATAGKDWRLASDNLVGLADDDQGRPAAAATETKLLKALVVAAQQAHRAALNLLVMLKTFKPVAQDRTPHKDFAAYLRMQMPTARRFVEKYKQESEGWEAMLPDDA